MRLTTTDINTKEFRKTLRGYSTEEVDEFLDQIVESYDEIFKNNENLNKEIISLNEKLSRFETIEGSINNTLIMAQNAADNAKKSARNEAEVILKSANESAQRILDKAHNDVIVINDEYDKVKSEFIKFRAKYRGFMNTQIDTFNELEKDLTKSYNVSAVVPELELNNREERAVEVKEEKLIEEDMEEIKSFFANS